MNDDASTLPYAEKAVTILQFNFPNGHPNLDAMKQNLEYLKRRKSGSEEAGKNGKNNL